MELTLHAMKTLSGLMDHALELDADTRSRWMNDLATGPHAALQPFLADMLARHADMDTAFLVSPIKLPGAPPLHESATIARLAAGARIGPYVLQREVGHGGMGSVWLADRADGALTRQVALKLPSIHLTEALAERFARERDILAQLTHPNIARLYDAGVSDGGRPYLALEYIEGKPITEHCDAISLSIRERLLRFLQVANAVQYAHANLVIHRDLKPGNILVSEDGQVHLLDFGIAKLLDDPQGQAAETELTMLAGRALTLDYASPEQVAGSAISTASDVYSMGVVLYELLTGQKPYQLKRGSRAELEEAILSTEAVRMSDAVRLSDSATVAQRGLSADRLVRGLAGDLDTIVNKAMKKDPQQRYATAAAFAQDLQRHLDGLPVEAQPDSWRYRAGKFVARHRLGVAATSAVAVALAAGFGTALWQADVARGQARRADLEAQAAKRETARGDAVQGYLVDLFSANSSDQKNAVQVRNLSARQLLDRGAEKLDDASALSPDVNAVLLRLFGTLYANLNEREKAKQLHQRSMQVAEATYGKESRQYALASLELAWVEGEDQLGKRLDLIEAARDTLARVAPESEALAQAYVYEAQNALASDPARTVRAASQALRMLDRSGTSLKLRAVGERANAHAQRILGDYSAALESYRRTADLFSQIFGPDNIEVGESKGGMATCLRTLLRLREAESTVRESVAIMRPFDGPLADAKAFGRGVAILAAERGNVAEAESRLQATYDALPAANGKPHGLKFAVSITQASVALGRGDARRAHELTLRSRTEYDGRSPGTQVEFLIRIAQATTEMNDLIAARAAVDEAKGIQAKAGLPVSLAQSLASVAAELASREGSRERALAEFADLERRFPRYRDAPLPKLLDDLSKARVFATLGQWPDVLKSTEPWLRPSSNVELPVAIKGEMQLLAGEAALAAGKPGAADYLKDANNTLTRVHVPSSRILTRAKTLMMRVASAS